MVLTNYFLNLGTFVISRGPVFSKNIRIMNLNECILNRKAKSKPQFQFITNGKCEEQKHNGRNLTKAGSSRESISEQMELTKTIKEKSTLPSISNWGSGCASVATSSSNRRSTNWKIPNESRTIVALTEGRGQARCEVGLAVINISSPVLVISQISDSYSYINTLTKINIFNPTEILFPQTFENFDGNRLMKKIKKQFPNVRYNGISRSLFNKMNGLDMLSKLCIPSLNGVVLVLQHRFYSLAATSALLSYIQDNLYIFYAAGSLKIDYQESEGYALIDVATADRLELVCSAKPSQANKHSTLFGILNHCYTKMGTRMLRSWILQPLFSVAYIQARLDCVDELMKNQQVLSQLQVLLQKLSNMESILNIATLEPQDPHKNSIRQLNYIINLRSIVDLINPLRDIISHLKQPFFVELRKTLEDSSFVKIKEIIGKILTDDGQHFKNQLTNHERCFSIKPTVNELLDVVRKIYTERINDMKEYVQMLAEKYNLPFTLGNNQKKGYHIILNINKQEMKTFKKYDLSDEFVEIQCSSSAFTMKTPELVNISTRVDVILEDILKISNVIVYNIAVDVKKYIPLFNKFCEEVAQLDIYQSLAQTSLENNYIRPDFGGYTEVKNGQHPMLNVLMPLKSVANTIFCSDDYNTHIITGPNGSGKSIFIRQVILLQIMAQLGSYVPAESAIFKPANKMCARINLDDNMEYNASSFVLEMKEIKYIMSTMTNDSLIIIDELGRSTSVEEGVCIAMAIVEKLSSFQSNIFVTTHFTMLGKMSSIYPHIKTWQMKTIPIGTNPKTLRLNYTYNLTSGLTQIGRYGVYIVRNIWPEEIIKIADDSINRLENQQNKSIFYPLDQKSVVKYNTESNLRLLKWKQILFIPKIKLIINRYEENLKRLNYNITNISISIINSKQDTISTDLENVNTDVGDYLPQQQFENIFPSSFTKQNCTFNLQVIPDFDFSNKHLFIEETSVHSNDYSTENSEFIKILHPIISLNESCSNRLHIQSPNFNSIRYDCLDHKVTADLSKVFTPPQYFKDNSNYSPNVNTRNESFDKYISPIVNIVQGLNDTKSTNSYFNDNPRNDGTNLKNKIIGWNENNNTINNSNSLPGTSTINKNDSCISNEQEVTSISGFNNSISKINQEFPNHIYNIVKDMNDHDKSRYNHISLMQTRFSGLTTKYHTNSSDKPLNTDIDNVSFEYQYPIKEQEFNIKKRKLSSPIAVEKEEILDNSISTLSNKKIHNSPHEDSKLMNDDNSSGTSNENKRLKKIKKIKKSLGNVSKNKKKYTSETNSSFQTSQNSSASPFRKIDSEASSSKSNSYNETPYNKGIAEHNVKNKHKKPACFRKKFVPPRKLSAKRIREDFEKQDREIMHNSTPSFENISKYVERTINRPSVNQIQNTVYLATLRKTGNGYDVLVPKPTLNKNKKNIIKSVSNNSIDITIFSDRNANAFEQFITSAETDLKNFHFNSQKTLTAPSQKSENNIFDYYMNYGQSQIKKATQSQNNFNMTLTPNGYYKQNKTDINNVISKYVDKSCSSITRFDESQLEKVKNIFESKHLSADDFDL